MAKDQQQMEERLAKLEAQSAKVKENVNVSFLHLQMEERLAKLVAQSAKVKENFNVSFLHPSSLQCIVIPT